MNYKYLILIIIIFIIVIITSSIYLDKTDNFTILDSKNLLSDKPFLWFYWEDTTNKRPGYIDICIDSIYKYLK